MNVSRVQGQKVMSEYYVMPEYIQNFAEVTVRIFIFRKISFLTMPALNVTIF